MVAEFDPFLKGGGGGHKEFQVTISPFDTPPPLPVMTGRSLTLDLHRIRSAPHDVWQTEAGDRNLQSRQDVAETVKKSRGDKVSGELVTRGVDSDEGLDAG